MMKNRPERSLRAWEVVMMTSSSFIELTKNVSSLKGPGAEGIDGGMIGGHHRRRTIE
jgi:hypothetical protein